MNKTKSTDIKERLAELHDKHFATIPYIINEMADDNATYHEVMDAFLAGVEALLTSQDIEEENIRQIAITEEALAVLHKWIRVGDLSISDAIIKADQILLPMALSKWRVVPTSTTNDYEERSA